MQKSKLPTRPSELIKLALSDLEKCEVDGEFYRVDMGRWHVFDETDNVCYVCLAGSVMAQTLGISHRKTCKPFNIEGAEDYVAPLTALEYLRSGHVEEGVNTLGYDLPKGMHAHIYVPTYGNYSSPFTFQRAMEDLAETLSKANL